MRQLKLLGLAIMAVLSLSVVASSAAQAVELKFLPEKAKFEFKSIGTTELTRLAGGEPVKCTGVKGSGAGVSERLGTVEFKFTGCTTVFGLAKCTGLSDGTAGNITTKGEYHIRHLLGSSSVDLVVLPEPTHFNCAGILFVVKGCVASGDLLTKEAGESIVGKLVSSFFAQFKNKEPTSVDTDSSLAMETCALKVKEGEGTEEEGGQIGKGTIEKCKTTGGAECTFLVDLSGTV